jgi:hypothetical protein
LLLLSSVLLRCRLTSQFAFIVVKQSSVVIIDLTDLFARASSMAFFFFFSNRTPPKDRISTSVILNYYFCETHSLTPIKSVRLARQDPMTQSSEH